MAVVVADADVTMLRHLTERRSDRAFILTPTAKVCLYICVKLVEMRVHQRDQLKIAECL